MYFEEKPNVEMVKCPPIEGYTDLEVDYHLMLMAEAGLLNCERIRSSTDESRLIEVYPFALSWQGHEFLDKARDETIWKQAMQKLKNTGAGISIAVLQALLQSYIKEKIGIK